MKNLVLIIVSIILLGGCGTATLKIDKQDRLVVKNDLNELIVRSKLRDSKTLNFQNISITQQSVQDQYNRVLFYEDVRAESIDLDEINSLLYIFGATQKYETVYTKNNLSLYQFIVKNDERMNVMVQVISSKRVKFVYGFSNYEFIKLAKKIKADSQGELKRLRYQGTTLLENQAPLTQWSKEFVMRLGKID